jgi:hypothetical protein
MALKFGVVTEEYVILIEDTSSDPWTPFARLLSYMLSNFSSPVSFSNSDSNNTNNDKNKAGLLCQGFYNSVLRALRGMYQLGNKFDPWLETSLTSDIPEYGLTHPSSLLGSQTYGKEVFDYGLILENSHFYNFTAFGERSSCECILLLLTFTFD